MSERSERPIWLGRDARGWDHARIHRRLLEDPEVGAYEIAVYVGLAIHAETRGGECFPALDTLAAYCSISERRVRTAIETLASSGWIEKRARPGLSSVYVLLPPPTPAPAAGVPETTPAPAAGLVRNVVPRTPAPGADEQEPGTRTTQREPSPELPLGETAPSFEEFWAAYPRRVGRAAAEKAWTKALRSADAAAIVAGAVRYASERKGGDPKFTAHPTTWLNAGRWADDPAPLRTGPSGAVDSDRTGHEGRMVL